MERLSSYAEKLSGKAKLCYQQKISLINWFDPFLGCVGEPVEIVPTVDASDLVKWFHMECLQITSVPKGRWYCPDCRKLTKGKRKSRLPLSN